MCHSHLGTDSMQCGMRAQTEPILRGLFYKYYNLFSQGHFIVSRSCDSVQVHRAKYRWFPNEVMAAMLVVMNKLKSINFSCKLFVKK